LAIALAATAIAKYFASTAAVRAAGAAIQIHGANGCSGDYPLQRYLGDAKVMEIIEGSTQIQELVIADYAYQDHGHAAAHAATAAWRSS
jgi:alkylation response protein AidB-like acyl-CoA dehydrogenase